MSLCRLPELPDAIRLLTNTESSALQNSNPKAHTSTKNCVTCGGAGRFSWYAPGPGREVVEYDCPCEDQLILHRFLLHCGIGTAYQRLGWSDADGCSPEAIAAVQSWLEGGDYNMRTGMGLLLTGGMGTGKSLLAVLLLKAMIARGFDSFFTTFPGLIDLLLSSWRTKDEGHAFHARCRNSGLLVVDDLGREMKQRRVVKGEGMKDYDTSSAEFAIESVLRHRVSMDAPTIITTNLTVEQMEMHYGRHFKSLLTESGQLFDFTGIDWRPQARARKTHEKALGLIRPVVLA